MSDTEHQGSDHEIDEDSLLTPEDVERLAEAELDKVLAFYKARGIELKRRPKIKFLDEYYEDSIAVANTEVQTWQNFYEKIYRTNIKKWYQYFGLNISTEAIDEIYKKMGMAISFNAQLLDKVKADIVLFAPLKNNPGSLGITIAHEVWHLIEAENGFSFTESYLHEGTATFAQQLYAHRIPTVPEIYQPGDIIYKYGSYLVSQKLRSFPDPLQSLLKPEIRERLEEDFKQEVVPTLDEVIGKRQDIAHQKFTLSNEFSDSPDFKNFSRDQTRENFLLDVRAQGLPQLVSELEHQDLSRYLKFLQATFANSIRIKEVLGRRENKSIDGDNFDLFRLTGHGHEPSIDGPLSRKDLGHKALIFNHLDVRHLEGHSGKVLKIVLASGEIKEFRAETLDEDTIYIFYPEDLGNLEAA